MAKSFNMSQFRSKMRQIESKQRQAVNNYNRAVRQYNSNVKKFVSDYNSFVRNYNSAVRRNRQIINREISKLQSHSSTRTTFMVSLDAMQQYYSAVNSYYGEGVTVNQYQDRILDLIEQEQANSVITANTVENNEYPEENTDDIEIGNKLLSVSQDLNDRWKGAVFSLNPNNPDACRHFCTSARELFTDFIELKAPDDEVFSYNSNCAKTERGNATRKEKIKYMLRNTHMDESVVNFVESDIDNILELFHVLSDGTHGIAGRYDDKKLMQVKKRVEQEIYFLCEIAA